jgi:hypothetical protein
VEKRKILWRGVPLLCDGRQKEHALLGNGSVTGYRSIEHARNNKGTVFYGRSFPMSYKK